MILAIIAARGGSKRIPRKNIRAFHGRPIIAYSIQAALGAGCFDEVMVSTDDLEIAQVARECGAIIPFLRSERASDDRATTADVILEVLGEYQKRDKGVDLGCCIYPTAPFVSSRRLLEGLSVLQGHNDIPSVIPVTRFSFPIQRALRMDGNRLSPFQDEHLQTRSQDLEPAYHDAGQFYWFRADVITKSRSLMMEGTAGLVLSEWEVQDIDNEDDWLHAEMKYKLILAQGESVGA